MAIFLTTENNKFITTEDGTLIIIQERVPYDDVKEKFILSARNIDYILKEQITEFALDKRTKDFILNPRLIKYILEPRLTEYTLSS